MELAENYSFYLRNHSITHFLIDNLIFSTFFIRIKTATTTKKMQILRKML